MIKKIQQAIMTLAIAFLGFVPVLVPASAAAQPSIEDNLDKGTCLSTDGAGCAGVDDADDRINSLIEDVINLFSLVVGVVSVIMIIIGGFRYITSGGESSNVTGAKNTIMYAIIGLVIVALAQFIVRFVLGKVTS